jgi:acid stress-induced BolA-like protein IbaG/YrbA
MQHEIQQLLAQAFPQAHIHVEMQGSHCHLTVVSDAFVDKTRMQRQQLVNRLLGHMITEGQLHALHMQTYTPQEWEQLNG